jgi:secreted trypsin-like serine protease
VVQSTIAPLEAGKHAKPHSGGPMFAKPDGQFTQIDITSWGIGCGAPDRPGVCAEVNNPSIRGFITNAASK